MYRKLFLTTLAISGLFVLTAGVSGQETSDGELASFKDKASYSVGYELGGNLAAQEMDLDVKLILRGLADAYQGKKHQLDEEDLRAVMTVYLDQLQKKQQEKWQTLSRENLKKGESFLKKNRLLEGVKELESGLQIKVLKAGDGATPKLTDRVKVHVRSTNVDGRELDNTYKVGEPVVFAVGGAMKGWVEALQRMKAGDKWTLYVPSQLSYGPEGFPPLVGPNETLIFEFELLEIVK